MMIYYDYIAAQSTMGFIDIIADILNKQTTSIGHWRTLISIENCRLCTKLKI